MLRIMIEDHSLLEETDLDFRNLEFNVCREVRLFNLRQVCEYWLNYWHTCAKYRYERFYILPNFFDIESKCSLNNDNIRFLPH